jgi:hypothetical protein
MKDLKDICEGIFDKENKNNVGNNFGAYSEFDILKKKFLDKNNYFKFNEYGEIGFRVRMKIPEICNDFIVQKTKTNPNSISINLDTIFNVAKMTDEDKDVILSSNVIKMIVNDYFNEDGIELGFLNINYEFFNINAATVECCNITNRRIYTTDVATKEQLLYTLEQFSNLIH